MLPILDYDRRSTETPIENAPGQPLAEPEAAQWPLNTGHLTVGYAEIFAARPNGSYWPTTALCQRQQPDPKLTFAARGQRLVFREASSGRARVAGCYPGCYVRITGSGELFRPYAGE
jgi:hypothetical protein